MPESARVWVSPKVVSPKQPYSVERIAVGVLALLALAYVPIYLALPLGRDQGLFAWTGMVVRDGGLPFRDAWEVKGPLAHFVYAIPVGLFGPGSWGVRLVDLVFVLGGMAGLFVGLRVLVPIPVATLGSLLLFVWYQHHYWDAAQPDSWASLLLVGCLTLLFLDRGERRGWVALLGGVLLGLMALEKPLYAAFCLLPPVYALASEPRAWRKNGSFVGMAALGALGVLALLVLCFLLLGGMEALVDIQLRFNLRVHQTMHTRSLAECWWEFWAWVSRPSWMGIHVMATIGLVAYARTFRREVAVVAVAYGVGAATIILQNKFYLYHFFIVLPPLLVGICLGLRAASEKLGGKKRTFDLVLRALVALLLVAGVERQVGRMYENGRLAVAYALGEMTGEEYDAAFGSNDYYFAELAAISRHISRTTAPGETVLVYGFDAVINFFADRPSPTRFGYLYPLVVGPAEFKDRYRAEFLDTLAARPPEVIVLAEFIDNNLYRGTADLMMRDFPELQALLHRDYTVDLRTAHYRVFRRKGGPGRLGREAAVFP